MSEASQIISEYFHDLEKLVDTFDFTRHGEGEALGKKAAELVAEGIHTRSENAQSGVDGSFPSNDPMYTDRKRKKYNVDLIGFRTGQMISFPSLLGNVDVTPHTVLIRYGTNSPPTSSMSTNYISASDMRITDTSKAWYFTLLKGRWYALDDTIADTVRELFVDQLGIFIRELNAR